MKATRTTKMIDGCNEPIIVVSSDDDFVRVEIQKCYHYIGDDTLYMREYIDGEFNAEEEFTGDFDMLLDSDAKRLAKEFSVYLN